MGKKKKKSKDREVLDRASAKKRALASGDIAAYDRASSHLGSGTGGAVRRSTRSANLGGVSRDQMRELDYEDAVYEQARRHNNMDELLRRSQAATDRLTGRPVSQELGGGGYAAPPSHTTRVGGIDSARLKRLDRADDDWDLLWRSGQERDLRERWATLPSGALTPQEETLLQELLRKKRGMK